MGNNESQPNDFMTLQQENWVQAGQDEQKILFSNVNPHRKRLLANILTNQLIEQYELNFIAEEDYNNYVKQLNFRKAYHNNKTDLNQNQNQKFTQTNKYIYPVKYFLNKFKKQLCTTVYTGLLYIDKVDLRLKEINDIPFLDLIYMYNATLEGFKCLYEKVGYFDIQEEMIFITRKGEIKVWMNSNLSKNYPNFEKTESLTSKSREGSECVYGSQAQMIRDLIQLIEKNSDENEQLPAPLFSYYLTQRNLLDRLSFDLCLQEFHRYLIQYNIYLFDYMRSISQLFTPDQVNNTARTNYEQSHVNQITTSHISHLNNLKRKFTPMQTIIENENYSSYRQPSYQSFGKGNKQNYHSSQVSNYSAHQYDRNQNLESKLQGNGFRAGTGSISDLNKSHHSVQSQNHHQHIHSNFQSNPSHFYRNNNNSHFVKSNIIPFYSNQFPTHLNNQGANQKFMSELNKNLNNHSYLIPHHNIQSVPIIGNTTGVKMINVNLNGHTQKVVFNNHPLNFKKIGDPIANQVNLNQRNFINQQNHQTPQKVQNSTRQPYVSNTKNNQNLKPSQSPIISKQGYENSSSNTKNQKQTNKKLRKSSQTHNSNNKLSKSGIKYHTIKETYQIDDQIANDLQKFLGLKVK